MGAWIKAWVWPQGVTVAAFVVAVGAVAWCDWSKAPPPDLMAAIQDNDVAMVRDALAKGAAVNQPDATGFYPLDLAISRGNAQVVEMLINAGASLRQVDRNGMDALLQAALSRKPDLLQLLIDRGAPLVNPARQHDLLTVAAEMNPDLVKVLLHAGADPNHRAANGFTPLHYALASDSQESAQLLLAAGAKPDASDKAAQAATSNDASASVQPATRVAGTMPWRPLPRFLRGPRPAFARIQPFVAMGDGPRAAMFRGPIFRREARLLLRAPLT